MAPIDLRTALQRAGLTIEEFADIVEVDPKSVGRWLSGTIPRPRRRAKIAAALDVPEADLWPHAAGELAGDEVSGDTSQRSGLDASTGSSNGAAARDAGGALAPGAVGGLGAHPAFAAPGAPDWRQLIITTVRELDVLEAGSASILRQPGVIELLIEKAAAGCRVRIVTAKPGAESYPLLDKPRIVLRYTEPAGLSSYRFDQSYFFPLPITEHHEHYPVIHVRRDAHLWLADRLDHLFEQIWENYSGPVIAQDGNARASGPQAAADFDSHERRGPRPTGSILTDGPRRWPGRRP